jgi:hypothetical protein
MLATAQRLISKYGKNPLLFRKKEGTFVTSGDDAGSVVFGPDDDIEAPAVIWPVNQGLVFGGKLKAGDQEIYVSGKELESWGPPEQQDFVYLGDSDTDPLGRIELAEPIYSGDEIALWRLVIRGWHRVTKS